MTPSDKTTSTLTTHHDPLCPRYRIACECAECSPPICLCDLLRAIDHDTAEAVRIAFYAAAKEAMG